MVPPDSDASEAPGDRTSIDRTATSGPEAWFAVSALRLALVIVGFVILLFALGQAVGFDLLGMAADALSTQLGRWLVVAFFGLVLIVIAVRGFGMDEE